MNRSTNATAGARMDAIIIEGARVVLPGEMAGVSVRIEHGVITGLDTPRNGARVVQARGMILAPAMVDIHGDAFERQLKPRPGVDFPLEAALLETDRQLAAKGIATAYHALTLSWEPSLRSVATGQAFIDALTALAPRLTVENRVHLRWKTFCFEALPLIDQALAGPLAPSIAFNDHTSMAVLDPGTPLQVRPFDHDAGFPVTDMTSPAFVSKMAERAKRSGLSQAAYVELIQTIWQRRPQVPAVMDQVAAKGRAAGVAMLSHDDSQVQTRRYYRDLGARICEFPMNPRAAEAARDGGDWIIVGAPNAARGGSHLGSPGAADMLKRGLCDILASDYFYPALLTAVARLLSDDHALPALWKLVSTNPARASGLTDRGEIALSQRADLTLIDGPEGGTPAPRRTLVAGRWWPDARLFKPSRCKTETRPALFICSKISRGCGGWPPLYAACGAAPPRLPGGVRGAGPPLPAAASQFAHISSTGHSAKTSSTAIVQLNGTRRRGSDSTARSFSPAKAHTDTDGRFTQANTAQTTRTVAIPPCPYVLIAPSAIAQALGLTH